FGDEARHAVAHAPFVVVSCFPFDDPAEVDALAEAVSAARVVVDPNPREGMLRDRAAFVRGFDRIARGAAAVKVGADDARLLHDGDLHALGRRLRAGGAEAVLLTEGAAGAT